MSYERKLQDLQDLRRYNSALFEVLSAGYPLHDDTAAALADLRKFLLNVEHRAATGVLQGTARSLVKPVPGMERTFTGTYISRQRKKGMKRKPPRDEDE